MLQESRKGLSKQKGIFSAYTFDSCSSSISIRFLLGWQQHASATLIVARAVLILSFRSLLFTCSLRFRRFDPLTGTKESPLSGATLRLSRASRTRRLILHLFHHEPQRMSFNGPSAPPFPPSALWQHHMASYHSLTLRRCLTTMTNLVPPRKLTTSWQIFILAEIIKQHAPNAEQLLPVVTNLLGPQQPNWHDMLLPQG